MSVTEFDSLNVKKDLINTRNLRNWKAEVKSLDYLLPPVVIPQQLINAIEPFGTRRFLKVEKPIKGEQHTGKAAFESKWQKNLYEPDDPSLQEWLQSGGNYGIAFGNGLIGIDCDDRLVMDKLDDIKTFTIKSGRKDGGKHLILQSDLDDNITLFKDPKKKAKDRENIGHVQVKYKYLVAPNSRHNSGNLYTITDDSAIIHVSKEDLKQRLGKYIKEQKTFKAVANKLAKEENNLVGNQIPITDLIDTSNFIALNSTEFQGEHPIHGSSTGQNFCINTAKNSWHCFRCGSGGGTLLWLLVKHGIIDCSEAGSGVIRGEMFSKALDLAEQEGFTIDRSTPKIATQLAQRYFEKTRFGNKFKAAWLARDILNDYRVITRSDDETIFVYEPTKGTYNMEGEILLIQEIKQRLADEFSTHNRNETLAHIKAVTYAKPPKTPLNILALKNGLLNIETGELKEFDPDYFILNPLNVEYDPNADCPRWMKFLQEVIDDENIPILQEWFGFCLYRNYFLRKILILLGGGSNGKSVALNSLGELLGAENISAVPLQALETDKFKTANLFGKLANICPDIPRLSIKDLSKLKSASGRDKLEAEYKFKSNFHFHNYAKLSFAANKLPELPEDEDAVYDRIILIDFPNQFIEGKNADPFLEEKLKKELSGIFNWGLEGLKRLLKTKKFSIHTTINQTREMYTLKSNPLKAFAGECLIPKPQNEITKDELFQAYLNYCERHKVHPQSKKYVSMHLAEHIPYVKSDRVSMKNKTFRVWQNIEISDATLLETKPDA